MDVEFTVDVIQGTHLRARRIKPLLARQNESETFSTDLFQKVGVFSAPQNHHTIHHKSPAIHHVITTQKPQNHPKIAKPHPKTAA